MLFDLTLLEPYLLLNTVMNVHHCCFLGTVKRLESDWTLESKGLVHETQILLKRFCWGLFLLLQKNEQLPALG